MHALLHSIGAVFVLPYVALAGMFLLVGEVARAKGVFGILDVLLTHANWFVRGGMYGLALLWLVLLGMGFIPQLQRAGSLSLCLLAGASLVVLVTLQTSRVEFGQWLFLLPCAAVVATSAWLFVRAGSGG